MQEQTAKKSGRMKGKPFPERWWLQRLSSLRSKSKMRSAAVALLLGVWIGAAAAFVPHAGASAACVPRARALSARSGGHGAAEARRQGPQAVAAALAAAAMLPLAAAAEEVTAFKASGAADVLGSLELGVLVLGIAVRHRAREVREPCVPARREARRDPRGNNHRRRHMQYGADNRASTRIPTPPRYLYFALVSLSVLVSKSLTGGRVLFRGRGAHTTWSGTRKSEDARQQPSFPPKAAPLRNQLGGSLGRWTCPAPNT